MKAYLGKKKLTSLLGTQEIIIKSPISAVPYEPGQQNRSDITFFVNQSGYDIDKPKIATITNISNDVPFFVKKSSDDSIVFSGSVQKQKANFSSFEPGESDLYYLECKGVKSYEFRIGKYLIQRVSINPALRFMDESRQDHFESGALTGYGWRDSHQFSFELNSLVMQYMANPHAYERMPYSISNLSTCKFTDLRVQNEPDIIWLMKFGVKSYYSDGLSGIKLHALIKAQLAYFLYIYPEISNYVTLDFYTTVRDFTISQWAETTCTKQWYEISDGSDNNLFEVQSVIGTIKGEKPPGYAIIPNLMMYEVLKRDRISGYQAYFDAAYNNCVWLVNNVDLDDPANTKGQRMSEHITLEALGYFLEIYPEQAPPGILEKIERWSEVMIRRSNNMWDFRKYRDPKDTTGILNQWTGGLNEYNETGNIAGFMASAYAARRVISDEKVKDRLEEIGIAQIDNVFGRNPLGRHHSYDAPREIEGVEVGWASFHPGGFGALQNVPGVLDGAPKEAAYPFNANAAVGYTEGWVAFNTAWNCSLAYLAADDVNLKIFNQTYTDEVSEVTSGTTIGIKLKAPLNFDYSTVETAKVKILLSSGEKIDVNLSEGSVDDYYFYGNYTLPIGITHADISYGLGLFKNEKRVTILT